MAPARRRTEVKSSIVVSALCLLLSAPLLRAEVTAAQALQGRWDGVIFFAPAENEVDVSIEVGTAADGRLQDQLWFPTQRPKRYEIRDLALAGATVSFHVVDEHGVVSSFKGELSLDKAEIKGMLTENEQHTPFTLHRRPQREPSEPPQVLALRGDGADLRQIFNRDADRMRLLIIGSPSSLSTRMSLRLIQRYVSEPIMDPKLTIYVVWEHIYSSDSASKAQEAAALVSEPRILHFWSDSHALGESFKALLGAFGGGKSPSWDMYMLFAPNRQWGDSVPIPDGFRYGPQMSSAVPPERRMNAAKMADEIRALLAAGK
jgi:hypothetical protein